MTAVLSFGLALLAAVLVSALAHRSVLSTAVMFLAVGAALGPAGLGVLRVGAEQPAVQQVAVLALFSVLFTDGMRIGARDLVRAWKLPGRALLVGMPLTFGLLAVLARLLIGLSWPESLLLAAVLSPTDPVFASAIVGREEIPSRLRHLLNVESGLNDGLALPVVLVLLALLGRTPAHLPRLGWRLLLGVVIGVGISWVAVALGRIRHLRASSEYEPLSGFAIGLVVFSVASLAGANEFLAAFCAGITVATLSRAITEAFRRFGELVTELLKLLAIMVFGALVSLDMLRRVPAAGYLFIAAALLVARPVGIGISLLGSRMGWREQVVAAWFGPKGFASVVYGLVVLQSRVRGASEIFAIVAVCVAVSIVAHSSTDVVIAHWFARHPGRRTSELSGPA